jgi:thiol-disulfide isomerase/thioredoxin
MDNTQPKRRFYLLAGLGILLISIISFFAISLDRAAATPSSFAGLPALQEMAQQSVPYEHALNNGRPTFLEFYADWCTTCQTLAPSISNFHHQYGSEVNFVMLDVDNLQWRQQIDQYQVKGVPQFFFITSERTVAKTLIGRVPEPILAQLFEQIIN